MNAPLRLLLDNDPIRFTSEGKIFILDAISAVSQTDAPRMLWERIKKKNPEIENHCAERPLSGGPGEPVCDSAGWELIQEYLFDYLIGTNG